MKKLIFLLLLIASLLKATAENGYECWLRYMPIENKSRVKYVSGVKELLLNANSPTMLAVKDEFLLAMRGMLGKSIPVVSRSTKNGTIIIGNRNQIGIAGTYFDKELATTGNEGYIIASKIINGNKCTIITANTDIGVWDPLESTCRHASLSIL